MRQFLFFLSLSMAMLSVHTFYGQQNQSGFILEGLVRSQDNQMPISGVSVSTDKGEYTSTNGLGEFKIRANIGDEIVFRSPEFETVFHRITSKEEITVEVQDFEPNARGGSRATTAVEHQRYLDSANFYKKTDIEKSLDFISKSISNTTLEPSKTQVNHSLTLLGEIYLYHKQFDLAVANLEDALGAKKTVRTTLLLAKAYVLNKEYDAALEQLQKLDAVKNMPPYQRIEKEELKGDAQKGMGKSKLAQQFYEAGLKIAEKNQVTPKIIDLSTKIAENFAAQNRQIEAEDYYNNSIKLSKLQAPERQVREKEKVADFYNQTSRYEDEIQLRKENLSQLKRLPKKKVLLKDEPAQKDSITTQRINYKIANAYIAQEKLAEAIPYLQKSIVEADSDNDLVVQKDATRKLSEVYEYRGDFDKAYKTYQEYVSLVDTLYIRKEQELSRLARLNREVANKQNRISSLEQERELSQSKYSLAMTEQKLFETRANWQKVLIYSLVMGMALFALTAFFFYRSNQKQKLANNLLALKSLRSQMNPHFIFNALNSVNNYIAKSDERSANRYLSDFSLLMRTVLENSEEDFIPFTKELELIKLYLKLEHSRFPDKFDYDIKIADEVDIHAFQIPPMLVQPYIENAVWHGLRYKENKGELIVSVTQPQEDMLEIMVTDNGIGRKHSANLKTDNQRRQKSKGMGNIKKRIAILNDMYKNKVDVTINDLNEDETGTKVVLRLKKD